MIPDQALTRFLRGAAVTGGALAVIGSAVIVTLGHASSWWLELYAFVGLFSVFFAVFVWLVIPQQPRNAVVWAMGASAFCGGLEVAGLAGAALVVNDPSEILLGPELIVPADLPTVAWILIVTEPAGIAGAFFPLLTFGLLLFPDGRLPSHRWRWVAMLAGVSILVSTLAYGWGFRPGSTRPASESLLFDSGLVAVVIAVTLSLVALVARFRRSNAATREQFRWVVWGASIFVPVLVVAVILDGTAYEGWANIPFMLGAIVFVCSYGIAVGRYQLFDINVVISRTFVVAGLAGFITGVYAAVVAGVGLLFGTSTGGTLPLSVAATVVVAITFQPLRSRMRRWADRLVYGERATPYEVLSRFSARMRTAVATEDVIPQMARLLAAGTGASPAIVWLKSGAELQPIATWPEQDEGWAPVPANDGEVAIPDADRLARVEHDGELLGAVTVTMPRGEKLTAIEERLVDDVASQAGLVLRNARLTADLLDTIQKLRSSRQRLVATQDEERRRLERDLHDGAQQQLVALKIKASLAQQLSERGNTERAADMLHQVVEDCTDAVESLRELAHGIYPPLLEAEGLEAALEARVAKAPVAVSIVARGLGRYSPEIEGAVFFCVLEALQNTVKYANATKVSVTLRHEDGRLSFQVADDGEGFDPTKRATGCGLRNMTDRLDALDGALHVQSTPDEGTSITGSLDADSVLDPATADRA